MPQLNSASFASQIFWLLVCFSLMWFFVAKIIAPRIADIMQRRQRKIDDCIAAADAFKQTAEDLVLRYNGAIKKAEQAAALSWTEAKNQLEEQSKKMRSEMAQRLQERMDKNEKELSKIEADVKSQVNSLAVDLAVKVLHKMEIETISKEQIEKVLREEVSNG